MTRAVGGGEGSEEKGCNECRYHVVKSSEVKRECRWTPAVSDMAAVSAVLHLAEQAPITVTSTGLEASISRH